MNVRILMMTARLPEPVFVFLFGHAWHWWHQ